MTDWDIEPCDTLEIDKDFAVKLRKLQEELSSEGQRNLRWIVNRSYFTGYKHAEIDNKGEQQNER